MRHSLRLRAAPCMGSQKIESETKHILYLRLCVSVCKTFRILLHPWMCFSFTVSMCVYVCERCLPLACEDVTDYRGNLRMTSRLITYADVEWSLKVLIELFFASHFLRSLSHPKTMHKHMLQSIAILFLFVLLCLHCEHREKIEYFSRSGADF